MIPGEIRPGPGSLTLNAGRRTAEIEVRNASSWPVGVGSHYHFFEANPRLRFDRDLAFGMRLDVPSGSITWFLPGEVLTVRLVPFAGDREVWGFRGMVDGHLDERRGGGIDG
jgi:urease subunit beta